MNPLDLEEVLTPAGIAVILALSLLSVSVWYVIIAKACELISVKRKVKALSLKLMAVKSFDDMCDVVGRIPENPYARTAEAGISCKVVLDSSGREFAKPEDEDMVRTGLGKQLRMERLRLHSGLTLLALAGSTAPFSGRLGTVAGSVSVMTGLGTGNGSVESVAGPIGETLVLTGAGILTALPAVFAWGIFRRLAEREYVRLEIFAESVHTFLVKDVMLFGHD